MMPATGSVKDRPLNNESNNRNESDMKAASKRIRRLVWIRCVLSRRRRLTSCNDIYWIMSPLLDSRNRERGLLRFSFVLDAPPPGRKTGHARREQQQGSGLGHGRATAAFTTAGS